MTKEELTRNIKDLQAIFDRWRASEYELKALAQKILDDTCLQNEPWVLFNRASDHLKAQLWNATLEEK